ncbi:hypothetical protein AGMMS49965_23340 [Bacteroidia bacterium]|nr:hypothetical protein AGMMS49965_23340 [Bacteroidia bacterium]
MKTVKFYSVLLIALLFSACEIDNYDEADGIISGTVIDKTTREGLQTEQPNGFLIYCREDSWTGSEEKRGQDFWGKADGTFHNIRIFKGSYSVRPQDGAFHTVDTKPVEIRSKSEAKVDFEVTPYCSFSDVDIRKDPTNAERIIATFTIHTHAVLPDEPATFKDYRLLATNRTPYVGNNVYDEDVSTAITKLTAAQKTEMDASGVVSITVSKSGFKAGKTYYIRVAARCDESPQARYNMTKVVMLTF